MISDELVIHYPEMRAMAHKLRGGREPEDLVQETFLRALDNLDRFKPEHIRAWLFTIMRNIRKNDLKWKSNKAFVELPEVGTPPKYPFDLFDKLRPVLRETAELYYVQGYTCEEIGKRVGCTTGTICSRLYKVRHDKSLNN